MTTYVNYAPSVGQPFSFQATFDNNTYTVAIPSSFYGQRLNISIKALNGSDVLYTGLVGSPANYDINILQGYFTTSTLVWRVENQQFEINP